MKGLRSLITPLNVPIVKNKAVARSSALYSESSDVFVRSETVKDIASKFRKQLIDPIKDWQTAFPADNEEGSALLKDILEPYTQSVSKLSKKDAESFARLVFGENHVKQLEKGAERNTALKSFKDTLEQSLGQSLTSLILKK